MIVGVDARVSVARGRGWGRYAEGFLAALSKHPGVTLRVLLPSGPAASRLAASLSPRAAVQTVPFSLPDGGDYLLPALDASDPVDALGALDGVALSLTAGA